MKKVIVLSDLHGSIRSLRNVLDRYDDLDYIIMLGDLGIHPVFLHHEKIFLVKGNLVNDYGDKYEDIANIMGHNIFITHGHRYFVHDRIDLLVKRAKELKCDIALFGHTHMVYAKNIDGILTLNPGSAFTPRNNIPPTYLLLLIDENNVLYSFREVITGNEIQI